MIVGVVDTTVIVHLYRRYAPAIAWYRTFAEPLGLISMTWLEIMDGAGSKAKQTASKALLEEFKLIYLTSSDQEWAMDAQGRYRLSHGVGINDCLIAAAAQRLGVPLYTHNLKDMTPLIGSMALRPYA
jgi:predicted nucleic acid-binding protein